MAAAYLERVFSADRRVIDYSPWVWQPLLQLVITDQGVRSAQVLL